MKTEAITPVPGSGIREDVFGWFDSPEQTTPAHDPGPQGLCPVCCHPAGKHGINNPIKTISIAVEDPKLRNRSYFFRTHKNCWGTATPHEKTLIESAVIDRKCATKPNSERSHGANNE